MAYILYMNHKELNMMDKAKTKVLISILKDSSLYQTMPHDEKISLLLRLKEEYPSLFHFLEDKSNEGESR